MSRDWDNLQQLLPNYDPRHQAGDCWFDADAADRACDFFAQVLHIPKGTKNRDAGIPFVLEAWQEAIVGNLFGWKRPDGTRRYRTCLIYVPKKNGKSAFVAGLILYVLGADAEEAAEIYSAASSRDQAGLIFGYADLMIRKSAPLRKRFRVYGTQAGSSPKSIYYEERGSYYKCLSADAHTADGVNPHFVAIDELHRHKTPDLAHVLHESTAARRQPLTVYTTTADYNRPSTCNDELKYARGICANHGDPDQVGYAPDYLPVVYELSMEEANTEVEHDGKIERYWQTPEAWRRVNPNIDVTVGEDFLEREARKAIEKPAALNDFLRLHLNIVTDAKTAWLPGDKWQACSTDAGDPHGWRERMLERLRGVECEAAIDLGQTSDLTALVLQWYTDDGYIWIPWFWVPETGAKQKERKHRVPYLTWIRQGYIEATSGEVTDYDVVKERILEINSIYPFRERELAVDKTFQGAQLCSQLIDAGIEVKAFAQSTTNMTAPTKAVEELVISGRLDHGNNPVLNWMAANAYCKQLPSGLTRVEKPDRQDAAKVDGIVAAIMAHAQSMAAEGGSVYDSRGLVFV